MDHPQSKTNFEIWNMSLQLQQLESADAFRKWKEKQKADLLHRWPSVGGETSMDYDYGAEQLDAMHAARVGWPCVIVFYWVMVERGPFLVFTVVTLDQFPKFRLLQLRLQEAEAELLRIRDVTERLAKGNKP